MATDHGITFDIRATWQARALAEAKGQTGMVLLSVLAHTYDEAMPTLLSIVFPHFAVGETPMPKPCLVSAAKVDKSGAIVADVAQANGETAKDSVVYRSETEMQNDFRRLADRLKLSDRDRIEMFKCVQRWVVADRRLDPTMNPQDPDAKRLVH